MAERPTHVLFGQVGQQVGQFDVRGHLSIVAIRLTVTPLDRGSELVQGLAHVLAFVW